MNAPGGPPRVGIAGGGTGGHIEPALNLADELRRRDPDTHLTIFGTERGLETTLVPRRGYALTLVPPVPLPRRLDRDLISLPGRLRSAVRSATGIVQADALDVVVGFGGYVAVPAYLGARRARVPFVVHEANARPGLANRLAARLTEHVAENYAGSLPHAIRVGCPLRRAITDLDRESMRSRARAVFDLPQTGPVLLVFGGSQGAARINEAVLTAFSDLHAAGVTVLHALGPGRLGTAAGVPGYRPVEYIDRMDLAYAAADLALCRSGAMTCAEVSAVGLPAIYVPYPVGNGEQRVNAMPVVEAGGGLMIDDAELDARSLTRLALPLLGRPERLAAMSERAAAYGIRDGAGLLADLALAAIRESA